MIGNSPDSPSSSDHRDPAGLRRHPALARGLLWAGGYAVLGAAWILLGEFIAQSHLGAAVGPNLELFKGLAFVGLSAAAIGWAAARAGRPQADAAGVTAMSDRRTGGVIALAVAGLSALMLALILAGLHVLRVEQMRAGERAVMALAHATEEVVARTVQVVDTRLSALAQSWRAGEDRGEVAPGWLEPELRAAVDGLPYVRAFWVLDADGRVEHDGKGGRLGEDHSDRDHFRAHRSGPVDGVHLGSVALGGTNGWSVSVSRALHGRDGAFAGVIVAALDPSYFAQHWVELDVDPQGSVALYSTDGRLLARSPAADAMLGRSFADQPWFRPSPPAQGWVDERPGAVDQVRRVIAARPVSDYPQLLLTVGRSTGDVLSSWHRFRLLGLSAWLLTTGLLAALGWRLAVELRRRRQSERELQEAEAQRDFALEAAGVGHWSMDLRTNVARRSPGHDRCFGHTSPVAEWGYETFLSHVHPEDRARVDAAYQRAMRGDGRYDVEFRTHWPDGSVHWLWSKGRFAIDDDGAPYNVAGIVVDITPRRLEAEALQRSERRFARLFEHSLDGILQLRADGGVLAANPAACSLFGYDEAALLAAGSAALVDASDPRWDALLARRERTGSARGEVTLRHADGHPFEAEVSSVVYEVEAGEAATSMFVRDVTDRRRAEERTQLQLNRLDLLREITRGITLRLSLDSLFDELARRLRSRLPAELTAVGLYGGGGDSLRLTAVAASEGGAPDGLAPGAELAADAGGLRRLRRGELVHEPELRGPDLELPRRLVGAGLRSAVLAPLSIDGEVFGVVLVARARPGAFSSADCEFVRQLCEHVALAAQQARLYEELQQAYDRLQRSQSAALQQERLHALGQMASGVAHDINNAISPVALYTESLLDTEPGLSDRVRRYLQTIQHAIDDVTRTVGRMREFSRGRDDAATLKPVQLNALVPQVLELTRARWRDMPQQAGVMVTVRSDLQPDLPGVLAAEGEIREALTNLVFNAVDAMPQGGTLQVITARRPVTASHPESVVLAVSDTGVGMDDETRRRCLEPFYTTKGERGTGLGLAMVYGTVQRHGGQIEIDSRPGEGTTVRLVFPVQGAGDAPGAAGAATEVDQAAAPCALDVLLVDDDALLLDSLAAILRSEGHRVTTAEGGPAGIEAVRAAMAQGHDFDVVITDLGMPHVDGHQVARDVKAMRPATAVVMLTGWGRRMSEDDAPPANVDLMLSKPPRLAELRAMVRQIASRARP